MITQSFRGEFQLRVGDWKYLDHAGSGGNNYNDPTLRPYAKKEPEPNFPGQLYNLKQDPMETNNLYEQEAEKRKEMQALLKSIVE